MKIWSKVSGSAKHRLSKWMHNICLLDECSQSKDSRRLSVVLTVIWWRPCVCPCPCPTAAVTIIESTFTDGNPPISCFSNTLRCSDCWKDIVVSGCYRSRTQHRSTVKVPLEEDAVMSNVIPSESSAQLYCRHARLQQHAGQYSAPRNALAHDVQ